MNSSQSDGFHTVIDAGLPGLRVATHPSDSMAVSTQDPPELSHPAVRAGHSDVVGLLPARPGPPDADLDAVRAALARVRAESLSDVEQTFNVAANDGAHANPGGDR